MHLMFHAVTILLLLPVCAAEMQNQEFQIEISISFYILFPMFAFLCEIYS